MVLMLTVSGFLARTGALPLCTLFFSLESASGLCVCYRNCHHCELFRIRPWRQQSLDCRVSSVGLVFPSSLSAQISEFLDSFFTGIFFKNTNWEIAIAEERLSLC